MHNVYTPFVKHPKCDRCRITETTRAKYRTPNEKRADGLPPLNIENESRARHRNPLIVPDLFSCCIPELSRQNKDAVETLQCLQRFVPPAAKPGKIHNDNTVEILEPCQELQWTHGTFTPQRSVSFAFAKRALRRTKASPATTLVKSGLSLSRVVEPKDGMLLLPAKRAGGVTANGNHLKLRSDLSLPKTKHALTISGPRCLRESLSGVSDAGGGRTGDSQFSHWQDLENCESISDVHLKRFMSRNGSHGNVKSELFPVC